MDQEGALWYEKNVTCRERLKLKRCPWDFKTEQDQHRDWETKDVLETDEPAVWQMVRTRLGEGACADLGQYALTGVQRVHNIGVWAVHAACSQQQAEDNPAATREMVAGEVALFHFVPEYLEHLLGEGFDPRLGGQGEYGRALTSLSTQSIVSRTLVDG